MLAKLSRGWLTPFECASLVMACIQLHLLCALNCCKANLPLLIVEGKQIVVTVHTGWCKPFNRLAFEFGSLTATRAHALSAMLATKENVSLMV
ncbi:hypothetical protein BRW62_12315 [Parathermosynechococcus lividus PCC 6715]|jgi:hypothetical protein|uniref:Uncharacterized protein n=1 Tax=Parathermosynechococcus lividus PCC 6715 TaxID=1917166 RepID=A0A2D2Q4C8_PARLV|nr:hypothetical protein BRW62_12315 [Thermostichus lividus PCC 6715]